MFTNNGRVSVTKSSFLGNGAIAVKAQQEGQVTLHLCLIQNNELGLWALWYNTIIKASECNILQNRLAARQECQKDIVLQTNYWGPGGPNPNNLFVSQKGTVSGGGRIDTTRPSAKPFADAGSSLLNKSKKKKQAP